MLIGLSVLAIIVLVTAAYWNSFSVPFLFDDQPGIVSNSTVRQFDGSSWTAWKGLLTMQSSMTYLTLIPNYRLGGLNVWGYHLVNLAIHILGAMTLFGITRRTLLTERMRDRFGRRSIGLAMAVAMIWALHPIQTEAVTYIIQRKESLMALFYLLTLYCVIRGHDSRRRVVWHACATLACLLGMATKQVMVSAPLVVLLYDQTFLSGSLAKALRRSWPMYACLAMTWALVLVTSGERIQKEGLGASDGSLTMLSYASTQFGVIVHYLGLVFWPARLCLDNAWPIARTPGEIFPYAAIVLALLAASIYALRRWPTAGFAAVSFFLILGPTSSVIVVSELVVEHRMYLPLAAISALAVIVAFWAWERLRARMFPTGDTHAILWRAIPLAVVGTLIAAEMYLTVLRNRDYLSELTMWADTVLKAPHNARAHNGLGYSLYWQGQTNEAIREYREAVRLNPLYDQAHNNLASALYSQGRYDEAIEEFKKALQLNGKYEDAHCGLGNVYLRQNRIDEAFEEYNAALELNDQSSKAHNNMGNAYIRQGRVNEAITQYQESLRLDPLNANAHNNLATALCTQGQFDDAIAHYQRALQLMPDFMAARNGLDEAMKLRQAQLAPGGPATRQ